MSLQPTAKSVYVGIDVAFAKKKRLPVSVCEIVDGKLRPLALQKEFDKPPAGRGNKAALDESIRKQFAKDVVQWMTKLQRKMWLRIERIAIDAPSDYCQPQLRRRRPEQALDKAGISCFATPTKKVFGEKIRAAQQHLNSGGELARLPSANQFWMLVGFSMFDSLKKAGFECIETYPQAIVHEMKRSSAHKSTSAGLQGQIEGACAIFDCSREGLISMLKTMGYGSGHDRLDALLSAWVASLPMHHQKVYGQLPDDAIVVPDMKAIWDSGTEPELVAGM